MFAMNSISCLAFFSKSLILIIILENSSVFIKFLSYSKTHDNNTAKLKEHEKTYLPVCTEENSHKAGDKIEVGCD
jgi:hypothetical protein